jgi:RHS repeat-associated protein
LFCKRRHTTGLDYLQLQVLLPTLGQFVSPDTLIPDPSNVQAYNRYMYVRGNPLQYADPTGHWCVSYINVGNTCAPDAPGVRWDAVQTTLDVAGMADPTPISDGANAVISVARGNYTDAGLSALAIVPYVGDLAKGGKYADEAYATGKSAWRWGREALGFSESGRLARELGLRGFTKHNYRDALMRFTGVTEDAVKNKVAHHLLPQEFADQFTELGIENIHDPRWLSWVPKDHHVIVHQEGYNAIWGEFIGTARSPEEILTLAKELAKEYGYDINFQLP